MKYKLIACDLDETLLNDHKNIGEKTQKTIAKIRKLGIKFVPATGRGYRSVKRTLNQIGTWEQPNQYVISYNGSIIIENYHEKIIQKTLLSFDKIKQLFQIGLKFQVPMHIYTMDQVFVFRPDADEIDYLDRGGASYQIFEQPQINFLRDQPLVKMLYKDLNRSKLKQIYQCIPQNLLNETAATFSSNRYLEFNEVGVNKGKGLLKLAKILKIKPKEIVAIGDNTNDLSMIKVAGLGIAVQNATPDVKHAATYITQADYKHDAVNEAIEKFILN